MCDDTRSINLVRERQLQAADGRDETQDELSVSPVQTGSEASQGMSRQSLYVRVLLEHVKEGHRYIPVKHYIDKTEIDLSAVKEYVEKLDEQNRKLNRRIAELEQRLID